MIDPAQTILFIIIIVLSILLIILGIQAFFVLKELRITLQKSNKVLDQVDEITQSISAPVSSISSLLNGLKVGSVVANLLNKSDHHSGGKNE